MLLHRTSEPSNRRRAPLLAAGLLFCLLVLAGCAARAPVPATEDLGKIAVEYRWTAEDAASPPAALQVWRSGRASGPYQPVAMVEIKGRPAAGSSQVLATDYGLKLGATYYYYLVAVARDGTHAKASPVVAATVSQPLGPGDARGLRAARQAAATQARQGKSAPAPR